MTSRSSRHWLLRTLGWLVALELAYLLIINGLLNLPLTQDVVNAVRPEKFHVRWERAWSMVPFRAHARGIQASGQSRSQQWQVNADAASGSIRLLPLVLKRVYLSGVEASNVSYRQRPRLKPDRDYTGQLQHYPEIDGWEVQQVDATPRKDKRPWKVNLSDATARGEFQFWIYNLQGSARGSAAADMTVETRGGPFSLDARDLDLTLDPALLNGNVEVFHGGTLSGELGFAPIVFRENRGLEILHYLRLDTYLDLDVASLAFINLFTGGLGEFAISGDGTVRGRLHYREAYMLAGTDLLASAANLEVDVRQMRVQGRGDVRIHTPEDVDKPLMLHIGYDELAVTRTGDDAPFLRGDSLDIAYGGSNLVVPVEKIDFDTLLNDEAHRERRKHNTFSLQIDDATLLDMAIINDYLPDGGSLHFTGGEASLQADISAGARDIDGGLQLVGRAVQMRAGAQDLVGDLDVDLVLSGGVPRELRVQLDGSTVVLDEVRVVGERQNFDDDRWAAKLLFRDAEAVYATPPFVSAEVGLTVSDTRPLVALFSNRSRAPRWTSRFLTLEDIDGEARLELANDRLLVEQAEVLSDKAELGAKAVFYQGGRDGVIYARYEKLDLVLKLQGQDSNIDVFRARQTFDAYRLEP